MSGLAHLFLNYDRYRLSILCGYPNFAMLLNQPLVTSLLTFLLVQLCCAAKLLQRGHYGAVSLLPVVEMEDVFDFQDRPEAVPHPVLDSPVFPAQGEPISSKKDKPNSFQVKRTLLGVRQTCQAGSKYCPVGKGCCLNAATCCGTLCTTAPQVCCSVNGGYCLAGQACCGDGCMPAANTCCPGANSHCNPLTSKCCGGGCVGLTTGCCSNGEYCVAPLNHCVILNGKLSCCKDSSCSDLKSTVKPITTVPTVTISSIPRPTVTLSPITVQAPISTATAPAPTVIVTPIVTSTVVQPSTTALVTQPSSNPVTSVSPSQKTLVVSTVANIPSPNIPETKIITTNLVSGNTPALSPPGTTILLGDSANPMATSLVIVNPATPTATSILQINPEDPGAAAGAFNTARDQLNSATTSKGGLGGAAAGQGGVTGARTSSGTKSVKPRSLFGVLAAFAMVYFNV